MDDLSDVQCQILKVVASEVDEEGEIEEPEAAQSEVAQIMLNHAPDWGDFDWSTRSVDVVGSWTSIGTPLTDNGNVRLEVGIKFRKESQERVVPIFTAQVKSPLWGSGHTPGEGSTPQEAIKSALSDIYSYLDFLDETVGSTRRTLQSVEGQAGV
jgi:hypothetical protein